MSDPKINEMSPKRNVVGGKRSRFTAAIVFFCLGLVSGIFALILPLSSEMIICRVLALIFGLLFLLFLAFGFMGKFTD